MILPRPIISEWQCTRYDNFEKYEKYKLTLLKKFEVYFLDTIHNTKQQVDCWIGIMVYQANKWQIIMPKK